MTSTKPLRNHVLQLYLTDDEFDALQKAGEKNMRTAGKQAAYYVREGLKREKVK